VGVGHGRGVEGLDHCPDSVEEIGVGAANGAGEEDAVAQGVLAELDLAEGRGVAEGVEVANVRGAGDVQRGEIGLAAENRDACQTGSPFKVTAV
jgi:hypothetical protein